MLNEEEIKERQLTLENLNTETLSNIYFKNYEEEDYPELQLRVIKELLPLDISITCEDGIFKANQLVWKSIHFKDGFAPHEYKLPFKRRTIEEINNDFFMIESNIDDLDILDYAKALDYFGCDIKRLFPKWELWYDKYNNDFEKIAEICNCEISLLSNEIMTDICLNKIDEFKKFLRKLTNY